MDSIPPAMWERSRRLARVSPRILAIVAVGLVLNFLVFASGAMAAQTYQVKVGGVAVGAPLAQGGVVWFNGYDSNPIVIHVGDTVQWKLAGAIHTVTSTETKNATAWVFDSSPLFPVAAALGDLSPGRLLQAPRVQDRGLLGRDDRDGHRPPGRGRRGEHALPRRVRRARLKRPGPRPRRRRVDATETIGRGPSTESVGRLRGACVSREFLRIEGGEDRWRTSSPRMRDSRRSADRGRSADSSMPPRALHRRA